ncbi:PEP-CTERM sorting domain-containing protein [Coraliomargarita parva]|uniref:PEP-CTERM sorting domain-containing protein n=1 Tax=Coraliomargarita parva TaxID=3014050 RepID=UPI0022B58C36|nr:PEP-CTERM sorting domain-containing protein [Coraliomargarita parva]
MKKYSKTRTLVLAAGILTALSASAQTTTIFSEDFSGTAGILDGQSPTEGTGVWDAASYVQKNGSGTTNATVGSSVNSLAFTLETGYVYELSIDIKGYTPTGTTSSYAGLGFFSALDNNYTSYTSPTPTGPWAFMRTQNSTASNVGDLSFRGQNSVAEQVIDSNLTITNWQNFKMVLNTSDSNAFTLALYVDDIQYGSTITYSAVDSATLLTDVTSVGFLAYTASSPGVSFDNFLFTGTTVIPEPSTFALLAGLTALTAMAVRRRK